MRRAGRNAPKVQRGPVVNSARKSNPGFKKGPVAARTAPGRRAPRRK